MRAEQYAPGFGPQVPDLELAEEASLATSAKNTRPGLWTRPGAALAA
jgi:hypothetical protein